MQGDRSAAIEDGYGLQQRTHLLGSAGSHLSECHGHHHRHRQCGACLHDFQTTDIVALETVHVIHAAENPFRSTAPMVGFVPTASTMWGRRKYAPVVIFQFDAHGAPVVQCPAATLLMTFQPTFVLEITRCRRSLDFGHWQYTVPVSLYRILSTHWPPLNWRVIVLPGSQSASCFSTRHSLHRSMIGLVTSQILTSLPNWGKTTPTP